MIIHNIYIIYTYIHNIYIIYTYIHNIYIIYTYIHIYIYSPLETRGGGVSGSESANKDGRGKRGGSEATRGGRTRSCESARGGRTNSSRTSSKESSSDATEP